MTEEKKLTGYPSIDKPWLKYYSEEAINAPIPSYTVFESIYRRNLAYGKNIALKYFGKKITYEELFSNVEKAKRAYERVGVKKGDIVVMITSSTPETVYSILALCRIGAVANMINPFFEPQQMIDRISETGANILVVLDRLYKNISDFDDRLPVKMKVIIPITNSMPAATKFLAELKSGKNDIPYDNNTVSWDNFIKLSEKYTSAPDAQYEKDRPFIMVYSSGTTGASKGIVLTNNGINAIIKHYINPDMPFDDSFTMLQMIPVWFSTGIVLSVLMPLYIRMTTILEPVFNEKIFVQDMLKYKPNATIVATSLWIYAMKSGKYGNNDMSFMKYPFTGGEKVLPETERELNNFLKKHGCMTNLLKGYGMCELGSTIATDSPIHARNGSVGFPLENIVVSIFDVDTNEEKMYGECGEIRALTPARMKGYFNNPTATEDFFYKDANGNMWGCTGDIGYMDSDGFLFVLGRFNDSFISTSGKRVFCFNIEDIILRHEAVNICKVVGIEHKGIEFAIAHIVLKDCENIDEGKILNEVHKLCTENLNSECVPYGYVIRQSMPIKNSGKLNIEELKSERTGIKRVTKDGIKVIDI